MISIQKIINTETLYMCDKLLRKIKLTIFENGSLKYLMFKIY